MAERYKNVQVFSPWRNKTFEGRYGAEEYISIAENRLKDINLRLKEIEQESLNDAL